MKEFTDFKKRIEYMESFGSWKLSSIDRFNKTFYCHDRNLIGFVTKFPASDTEHVRIQDMNGDEVTE